MKKTKIILMALLSTLLFTACSSSDIVEPETTVYGGGDIDNIGSQNPEQDDIEIGINDGDQYETLEDNVDIMDIFNDTYWVTRTGAIEDEIAMSIHPGGIYGFSLATGDIFGGRIEFLETEGNTAYVSTYFTDGNGNATIEYVITQNEPGVIIVTEKWLKEPKYEYTEAYYQITKEEYSNL